MGLFNRFRSVFSNTSQAEPKLSAEEASSPQERRTRTRIDAAEGTRVLIIDDSPTIIAALKKFLRSAGYEIFEALDAESGLEIARTQAPQLIFLDIVLPGMNGFAALRAIRKDPQLQDTPVIMMSGNEQATEQFFGTRIGADDFMKKPFARFEVFARIERLLDEKRVLRRPILATTTNEESEENTSQESAEPA